LSLKIIIIIIIIIIYIRPDKIINYFDFFLIQHFLLRTPYYLAKDKLTRDAFRKARGLDELEFKWDWETAGVPTAITGG